ncbi:MAG: hypothetical protein ABI881_13080 [Betaproteobacteria bacterium]
MNTAMQQTAVDAGKVLDSLAVLSSDLACQTHVPPHTLILRADKLKDACDAIDEAVRSLRHILMIAAESGAGPATS